MGWDELTAETVSSYRCVVIRALTLMTDDIGAAVQMLLAMIGSRRELAAGLVGPFAARWQETSISERERRK